MSTSKLPKWNNYENKNWINWLTSNLEEFRETFDDDDKDIDYYKKYCKDDKEEQFTLKNHQKLVKKYMMMLDSYEGQPKSRGILLFHGLGSGKTCSSIAIADGLKIKRKIVILTPAALRNNFKNEIIKCGEPLGNPDLDKYIINYVSTNASNTLQQIKSLDVDTVDGIKNGPFDNRLVIVDEIHNLISMITGEGKQGDDIYNIFMDAKNVRFVFLSGTPLINYPFEIAIMMNILRGKIRGNISKNNGAIFPIQYDVFNEEFLDGEYKFSNAAKRLFMQNCIGLVSYFGSLQEVMPNIITKGPILVEMSDKQFEGYKVIRDIEIIEEEKRNRSEKKEKSPVGYKINKEDVSNPTSFRVHSREASNFVFPGDIKSLSDKDHIMKPKITEKRKGQISETVRNITDNYTEYEPTTDDLVEEANLIYQKTGEKGIDIDFLKDKSNNIISKINKINEYREKHQLEKKYESYIKYIKYIEKLRVIRDLLLIKNAYKTTSQETAKDKQNFKKLKTKVINSVKKDENLKSIIELLKKWIKAMKFEIPEIDDDKLNIELLKKLIDDIDDKEIKRVINSLEKEMKQNVVETTYEERIKNAVQQLYDSEEEYFLLEKEKGQLGLEDFSNKMKAIYILMHGGEYEYRDKDNHTIVVNGEEGKNSPVVVYSNFKAAEGVGIFRKVLEKLGDNGVPGEGYKNYKAEDGTTKGLRYALWVGGENTTKREKILEAFNNPKNKDGSIIKVLIVTLAGAEGISLKNVRQVHLMEPYWNNVKLKQVVGRAVRICSHKDLPEKDRNVHVYTYLSVHKDRVFDDNELFDSSTDEYIYELAQKKEKATKEVLAMLMRVSFDCNINLQQNLRDKEFLELTKDLPKSRKCFNFNSQEIDNTDVFGIKEYGSVEGAKIAYQTSNLQNKILGAVFFNSDINIWVEIKYKANSSKMEQIKKHITNNREIVWFDKKDLEKYDWEEGKKSIVYPKKDTKLYIVNKEGEKIDLTWRTYGISLGIKKIIMNNKEIYICIIEKY